MADAPDKVLLRFEGDASGVAAAAAQAKQHLAEVENAAAAVRSKSYDAGSADPQLQMLLGGGGAASPAAPAAEAAKAASAFDEWAKSMGTSQKEVNALRMAIGRVSPELGALLDMGTKGPEIFSVFTSGLGKWVLGIGLAAGAVSLAIKVVKAELDAAQKKLDEFAAANDRVRNGARTREGNLAESFAAAGRGPEQINKARAMVGRLVGQGFDESTVTQLAPFLLDEAGGETMDAGEMGRYITAVQSGQIEAPSGSTAAQRQRSFARGRRQVGGRIAEDAAAGAETLAAERLRQLEEAASGSDAELSAFIGEKEGLEGEPLAERVSLVRRHLTEGPKPEVEFEGMGDMPGWTRPGETLDPMVTALRAVVEQQKELIAQLKAKPPGGDNYGTIYQGGPGDAAQRAPRVGQ